MFCFVLFVCFLNQFIIWCYSEAQEKKLKRLSELQNKPIIQNHPEMCSGMFSMKTLTSRKASRMYCHDLTQ